MKKKMTCAEFDTHIADYYEGGLRPRDLKRFQSHCSGCCDCSTFLAAYGRIMDLLEEERLMLSEWEQSLLNGLRAGDPASFEEVVRIFSARLLATASRIRGNEAEAQDVVQEALIAAWKGIGGFEGGSSLYTWLHRITVNVSLARMRTASAQRETSMSDGERQVSLAFEGLPAAWSHPGPDLEERLAMRRAIQKALELIPEDLRVVLVLRDVEQMSSREVADRLGIPDTAVRQRLHRARTMMAELLRPELCAGRDLTCGGRSDLLFDWIDNVLSADLQAPVEAHIAGCERCSELRDGYRETIGIPRAIAALTEVEAPRGWVAATVERAAIGAAPLHKA